MLQRCVLAVVALVFQTGAVADEVPKAPPFELRDGDRVVFLGNTFFERAQKYGHIETALTARYPDRHIVFRNLGWDGDTVWAESRGMFDSPEAGYKRMLEQIAGIKPTVIFLAYGNNEAFAGKEGLPAFEKQYEKLLDDLTAASAEGVRFVLISPLKQLRLGPPLPDPTAYNRTVLAYANAVEHIAAQRNAYHVNLNPIIDVVQEASAAAVRSRWTDNSVSWKQIAYQSFANGLAVALTGDSPHCGVSMNADGTIQRLENVAVAVDVQTHATLHFVSTPRNVPLEGFILSVFQLPRGDYELRVDGAAVDRATAEKWKGRFIEKSPDFVQAEQLRQAIIEKNRLYFHHWRPQNITYLFGFRKHEQGQNAKEVAEFEQLVAEKEREIARLKKPVTRTYELIRVKEPPKE